jgi:hypothetical protein
MNCNDLQLRLLAKLRARGKAVSAVGIDLGITKSALVCAQLIRVIGQSRPGIGAYPRNVGSNPRTLAAHPPPASHPSRSQSCPNRKPATPVVVS